MRRFAWTNFQISTELNSKLSYTPCYKYVNFTIMSKRVKINFETINKGKYEIIPWEKIHETNKRIKEAMRKLRGKFK
jgi:hypothetical protein